MILAVLPNTTKQSKQICGSLDLGTAITTFFRTIDLNIPGMRTTMYMLDVLLV